VYVLVRSDLSPSQQAVQAIHAAVEASRVGLIDGSGDHPHLVVLSIPDESSLLIASEKLRAADIPHAVFVEPDLGDEATALATAPLSGDARRHFRRYRLLELGRS
jgi:hypothetical protein